ncbi:MAG: hypothetical protein V3U92_03270 [Cellulophaga sp.]
MNIKTVGLFGAKSTMTNDFYQKTRAKYGLDIIMPTDNEVDYIHNKYIILDFSLKIFNDQKVLPV